MGRPCRCCEEELTEVCGPCSCWCMGGGSSIQSDLLDLYDWVLLICNSNAAKDDEISLSLNGVDFGRVNELGEDKCQGKYFATSQKMLDELVGGLTRATEEFISGSCDAPPCCIANTTASKIVDRQAFNFCHENSLIATLEKKNFNGNFGSVLLWRKGPKNSFEAPDAINSSTFNVSGCKEGKDYIFNGSPDSNDATILSRNICLVYSGVYLFNNISVGQRVYIDIIQPCCRTG